MAKWSPGKPPIKPVNSPVPPTERGFKIIFEKFLGSDDIKRTKAAGAKKIVPPEGNIRKERKPVFLIQEDELHVGSSFGAISKPEMAKAAIEDAVVNPIIACRFNVIKKLKTEIPNPIGRDIGKPKAEEPRIKCASRGHGKIAPLELIVDQDGETIVDLPVDLLHKL